VVFLVALAPVARDRLELGATLGAVCDEIREAGAEPAEALLVVREPGAGRELE
jgi:adenine/guanine phosphoribosyltransferase-like PRPP-binding protein